MSLKQLNIHQLRNISNASLALHPSYNIFYGENGSGKTSVLEAIYLLGSGHSFRTREVSPLINYNETALTVFARTDLNESISIQKTNNGLTQVKINQQTCHRSSELAHFLPCQVFYQDIFQIIDAGPAIRRSLLDWGLFHVKQSYHELWKDYRRILKQRNALLRQKANYKEFVPWDKMLIELADELHQMRHHYFLEWSAVFQTVLAKLTDVPCTLDYYKGWDKRASGKSLALILIEQFASDTQRQYTHSGIHQADILFDSAILKAKQTLSRGQQKIILIALKLAQAQLLNKPCLYLFDDITAELDMNHIKRLIQVLTEINGQFFFTTINLENLLAINEIQDIKKYALNHGFIHLG